MGIMNGISRIIGAYTKSTPMEKSGRSFIKNADKALGAATVTSIVVKDGIGCVMYVTQSMNNKKIPEEKRKFVAALDLTNGVLMIAAQIAMFFAMRKYSGKFFNWLFKGSFNPLAQSDAVSRFRMKTNQLGERVYKKYVGCNNYNEFKNSAASVFKFCLDIGAATIVGKRVIVPLIATPLAGKVKKWLEKRDAKKGNNDVKAENNDVKTPAKPVEVKAPEAPKFDTGSTNLLDKYKQK